LSILDELSRLERAVYERAIAIALIAASLTNAVCLYVLL
jgi:hypothetical protein